MFHFYTPWKWQKTTGFQTFSGDIEMEKILDLNGLRTNSTDTMITITLQQEPSQCTLSKGEST